MGKSGGAADGRSRKKWPWNMLVRQEGEMLLRGIRIQEPVSTMKTCSYTIITM